MLPAPRYKRGYELEERAKVATSIALLLPVLHTTGHHHPFVNQASWLLMCVGCTLHHSFPDSSFWHDMDQWIAQLSCGGVLLHMEGEQSHWVALYLAAAIGTCWNRGARVVCSAGCIVFLTVRHASLLGLIWGVAAGLCFVLQHRVSYGHVAWHVFISLVGYNVTAPFSN